MARLSVARPGVTPGRGQKASVGDLPSTAATVTSPTAGNYSTPVWNGSAWVASGEIRDGIDICAEFGVSTALSDNSVPINTALATLGPLGLRAVIPKPGNYHIQNPIVIGNGVAGTSLSTWTAQLEGMGSPGWLDQFNGPRVQITWAAAAGGTMVQIAGPVAGWGLKRLFLHGGPASGGGVAAIPLQVISGQFGDVQELYTFSCYTGIVEQSSAVFGGNITNTMHNRWRKIGIAFVGYPVASPSSRNAGILFTSLGRTDANVCFEDWDEVWINVPNSSNGNQLSAIHLGGSDSNWLRGIHPLYVVGGTDPQFSVTFDYTDGNAGWPEGAMIEGINIAKAPRNVGTPTAPVNTAPNRLASISGANSGVTTDPALQNLSWENPRAPTERQQAQPGIIAPSDAGWSGANQVAAANQGYFARFVPDRDMTVALLAINVTTAATNNDSIDVGVYDSAGNRIASTGSTAALVNATGLKTITLACTLVKGQVYYAALAYGAVGGTAATIQMANFNATSNAGLFGAGLPNARAMQQATVFPLPGTVAPAVNSIGCMIAVRTS